MAVAFPAHAVIAPVAGGRIRARRIPLLISAAHG